jgi:hypothetical protein
MDKSSKGKKVTAQGISESPSPVGSMSSPVWFLQAHPNDYHATGETTEEISPEEGDVEVVNTRCRAIRPGNTSQEKAKKGIGLQTDQVMEEISIIP